MSKIVFKYMNIELGIGDVITVKCGREIPPFNEWFDKFTKHGFVDEVVLTVIQNEFLEIGYDYMYYREGNPLAKNDYCLIFDNDIDSMDKFNEGMIKYEQDFPEEFNKGKVIRPPKRTMNSTFVQYAIRETGDVMSIAHSNND